jgi:exopolyphosphatase/guanosine-5'-triphosphate,3'-diphosphate pyrophosphatase
MNPEAVRQEARALLQAHDARPQHVLHVAYLATELFRELTPLHRLGEREALLLEVAALLHDLGRAARTGGLQHHKESARLIRQHPWQSLGPAEIEVVAQAARYHRKTVPHLGHQEFAMLPPPDQKLVMTLAALLRVADGLDRTHRQLVTGLRARIEPEQVTIQLFGSPNALEELTAARRKAILAELVFQRPFKFLLAAYGLTVSDAVALNPAPEPPSRADDRQSQS